MFRRRKFKQSSKKKPPRLHKRLNKRDRDMKFKIKSNVNQQPTAVAPVRPQIGSKIGNRNSQSMEHDYYTNYKYCIIL